MNAPQTTKKNKIMKTDNRKFNTQTGCYKIDIYVDKVYACSTDQAESVKKAKARYLKLNPNLWRGQVHAEYFVY